MNALFSTLVTAYRTLLRDPQTRGWVVFGSLLYLVSPIDLSPDLLPVLGQIDDIALVALLFSELSRLAVEGWRNRFGASADATDATTAATGDRGTDRTAKRTPDRDYTQTIDVSATPSDAPGSQP